MLHEQRLIEKEGHSTEQHVVYRLSPIGAELGPIFESLGAWGSRYAETTKETKS